MSNVEDSKSFPRIGLKVNGEQIFVPMNDAAVHWDSGYDKVELSGGVLEENLTARPITNDEQSTLQRLADNLSMSK